MFDVIKIKLQLDHIQKKLQISSTTHVVIEKAIQQSNKEALQSKKYITKVATIICN